MNFEITVLFCISFILRTQFRGASCQELYVGCYTHFSGLSLNKKTIQSVSQCLTECRSQISSFAAIKDGSSCYCGNITNTRVSSSSCNLTCGGNICGGNNLFAVYTDIPTYQGCFKDDNDNRDMTGTIFDDFGMTMDKCYEKCSSLNYRFMGTASGGSCFCGQQFGKHGRAPESDCNMTCTGGGNQICGGVSRNSVYSVGYLQGLNKSYSQVFHCLNGATDMYGTCTNKCQPGWKGTKCNQRDCALNNGSCGEHKCEEITIGNQIISECICKEGFQSISVYDGCTDIDECQSNPCNEPSETCINTIGSFVCNCSPGYNNISQLGCDVQCIGGLPKCQKVTSCEKIQNYKCLSNNFDKSPDLQNNGHITSDKRDAIILATFLTFSIGTQIFLISAVIYYKRKNKKLAISVREQSTDTMTDSTYKQLDFSSQSPDDHNYSELTNNGKK